MTIEEPEDLEAEDIVQELDVTETAQPTTGTVDDDPVNPVARLEIVVGFHRRGTWWR